MRHRTELAILVIAILLAAVGWLGPAWLTFLFTVAFAKALVALGVVLQMRTGLVSFGQALYYCIGGYAAGLAAQHLGVRDAFVMLALGITASLLLAGLFGLLLTHYRDIFYAMLTMALSMVLFGVLVKSSGLGSTDGFNVAAPSYIGFQPADASRAAYALTLAICVVVALVFQRVLNSNLGRVSEAIRENELRVEYLGFSPRGLLHANYCAAAALSAIGGGLVAIATGHVDPDMAFWTTSGEFVFIALLGGSTHVAAPFIAALVFSAIRTLAIQEAPNLWQLTLGMVLLALVAFLPKGLWSLGARVWPAKPNPSPLKKEVNA